MRAGTGRASMAILVVLTCLCALVAGTRFVPRAMADTATPSGSFVPLPTTRILDTRFGFGAPQGSVAADATLPLQVAGVGGVPAIGAGVVVLMVRATASTSSGAITVYAAGSAVPSTVSVFYSAGQTIAATVPVALGTGGVVNLFNQSTGSVHMLAEVTGYYTSGAGTAPGTYNALPPTNVVNTASGLGVPAGPLAAGSTRTVQLGGTAGVPASGINSVTLAVTVAQATWNGSLRLGLPGSPVPSGTSLDYSTAKVRSQVVIAPVDASGRVALSNVSTGTVTVFADVIGYSMSGFAVAAGAFRALPTTKIMNEVIPAVDKLGAVPPATVPHTWVSDAQFGSAFGGSPVSALALKVSVSSPTVSGNLTVFPSNVSRPAVSNVTFTSGQTGGNLVLLPKSAEFVRSDDGLNSIPVQVMVANTATAPVTVTVDVVGFFTSGGSAVGGNISDSSGVPLAGVTVALDYSNSGVTARFQGVTTGPDGVYYVPAVSPGQHNICFFAPTQTVNGVVIHYQDECYDHDFDQFWIGAIPKFTVAAGAPTVIDVQMVTSVDVNGTVTDTTGRPLKSVSVLIRNPSGSTTYSSVTTGSDGRWSATRLPVNVPLTACFLPTATTSGGSYDALGYFRACWRNVYGSGAIPFTLTTTAATQLTQSLPAAGGLTGTVRHGDGTLCNNCAVAMIAGSSMSDPTVATTRTAANGTYSVRSLAPATYHVKFGDYNNTFPAVVVSAGAFATLNGTAP